MMPATDWSLVQPVNIQIDHGEKDALWIQN